MKIQKQKTENALLKFINFITGIVIFCSTSTSVANDIGDVLPNGSTIAARAGIMQFIIVPIEHKRNQKFHINTIKELCPGKETCFLNFFTNSSDAELKFPLDEKILSEPTLIYRRSSKHQNATFQWSCRLKLAVSSCF